jgi:hypothetical protein
VNHVVSRENVLPTALTLAEEIAQCSPQAIEHTKHALLMCKRFLGADEATKVGFISSSSLNLAHNMHNNRIHRDYPFREIFIRNYEHQVKPHSGSHVRDGLVIAIRE